MFGWRRKSEGFVWHDYVRTTILVRRDQRRQKIEDLRDAAVSGVKSAGRQGVELGVSGIKAAGSGVWTGLRLGALALWDILSVGLTATWLWIVDWGGYALSEIAAAAGTAMAPAIEMLRKPTTTLLFALVAAISAISAAARASEFGHDGQALLAGTVSAAAFLALIISRWPELSDTGSAIARRLGLDRLQRPSWLKVPSIVRPAIVPAFILAAAIALTAWLGSGLLPGTTSRADRAGTDRTGAVRTGGGLVPSGSTVEGKAAASSGIRLRVGGTDVQLYGIEAPEATQACGNRSCAAAAKSALQKLVQGKRATCSISGRAEDGIASATCVVDGADVAAQLVRAGHVFSSTGLFATYASAEREARNGKLGLWKSNSDRPAEHRAKVWEEAKRSAPDGCPIKGVVSGEAKTYVAPWSPNYDRTKVRASKGERWFCSESEARQAGWRPTESL